MDRIDASPAEWDQMSWVNECGTTMCLAGHVLMESGYTLTQVAEDDEPDRTYAEFVRPDGELVEYALYDAVDLLGMNDFNAHRLFVSSAFIRDRVEMRNLMEHVIAHPNDDYTSDLDTEFV